MNYPNDYDTPAFPAGKSIAFTRVVSIWISIVFFLIVCTCGFILLSRHLKTNYPFLLSVDPFSNEWSVIAYPNKNINEEVDQQQIIQDKLVRDFVTSWFTISENKNINEERWKNCSVDEDEEESVNKCEDPTQYAPGNIECSIYCNAGIKLYEMFATEILPEYQARFLMGPEYWRVGKMDVRRIDKKDDKGKYNENTARWQVYVDVFSNINSLFKVLVFIDIDRDLKSHSATFGYYVKDFNSYRITQ